MIRTKQVSVTLENKPGRLAALCRNLADKKINIVALSVVETSEQGIVRLVVDKPDAVVKLLRKLHLPFMRNEVLLIELRNRPGALASLTEKLSAENVNIGFVYGSTGKKAENTYIVLWAPKLAAVEKALAS